MEFTDDTLLFAAIGVMTLAAALLPRLLGKLPISIPMVFLAAGIIVFALIPDLPDPHPSEHPDVTLHLTEICVLVSLMGAGLAINRPLRWRTWSTTWRLLAVTMPLSIAAVAVLGWVGLGLGAASALLLAAALAPTDPVLATEVQVSEPVEDEMRRQGWDIGRDQTERLMRLAGVRGVRKSKRVFTTRSDKTGALPSDLVNRRFTAPAPRRLWVCDVTYVATWSGFAFVAFVTDVYSRRIVGWNVAATLRSEILPLQALDMAAWGAGGRLDGLIHHADHGSNYTAMVYTERIVELGAVPSTGTVGDSFDNAMAEAVNNLYKTELIRQRGPWRTVEQVELATLEWVWWWNNQRLHGELDMRTPNRG
ncbi:IS3 family transposase [Microbacterium flavum]|uniref:IS3 family transposase n=1 Tax=Microbacterium flavum TaxID=415216 RepID=A0ABS5XQM8_9MICO|nr:IS3 family transposase [Microbacterium flavum]